MYAHHPCAGNTLLADIKMGVNAANPAFDGCVLTISLQSDSDFDEDDGGWTSKCTSTAYGR